MDSLRYRVKPQRRYGLHIRDENLAETQLASALSQKGIKTHHKSGHEYMNWVLKETHPLDGRAGKASTEIWSER